MILRRGRKGGCRRQAVPRAADPSAHCLAMNNEMELLLKRPRWQNIVESRVPAIPELVACYVPHAFPSLKSITRGQKEELERIFLSAKFQIVFGTACKQRKEKQPRCKESACQAVEGSVIGTPTWFHELAMTSASSPMARSFQTSPLPPQASPTRASKL